MSKLSVKEIFQKINSDIIVPINEIKTLQVRNFLTTNFNEENNGFTSKNINFNVPLKNNEIRSTSEMQQIQIPELALTHQNTLNVENIEMEIDSNFIESSREAGSTDNERTSDCKITIKLGSKNINLFDYMNN